MQEAEKLATAAASKAVIPLACAAMATVKEAWAAYSEGDIADLKTLIQFYKKHCVGDSQLARYTFDPSFNAHLLAEEKRPGFDPLLPIYFQFDDDKKLPFLYDEIQGNRYAPCKDSQSWFEQVKPGHLASGIEEAIGYVCEIQRIRDQNFLQRHYSYDPANMFCEELKAWLLQLSNVPLDNDKIILKIKARITYLEKVRRRAALFKEQGMLAELGWIDKYSPVSGSLVEYVKEIIEKKLLPIAQEIYAHRSAREHFEKLTLNIAASIKEQVCFLFYVLQDAKVSPNFLLQELALVYPRVSSYENSNSLFRSLLRHLVCSDTFLMVFPQLQPKIQSSPVEPLPIQALPHNICVTQNFVNDFRDEEGLARFPKPIVSAFKNLQLSDCELKVADKKKINLGVLPVFKNAADIKTVLEICAHLQMLCFCHALSKEFFELAGEGGNLVTYRLAAKKLDPILEKFGQLFEEGKLLIDKIKRTSDAYYDHYRFSQNNGKTSKRPEGFEEWVEKNYEIANDVYGRYATRLEAMQKDLIVMKQEIKKINSPEYDQYFANKLARLERLILSFCQFYPDLSANDGGAPEIKEAGTKSPRAVQNIPPLVTSIHEDDDGRGAAEVKEANIKMPQARQTMPSVDYQGRPAPHMMFSSSSVTAVPKNVEPLPGLDCRGKNNIPRNRGENRVLPSGVPSRKEVPDIKNIENHSKKGECPQEILEELAAMQKDAIHNGESIRDTLAAYKVYSEDYDDKQFKIAHARVLLTSHAHDRLKALDIIKQVCETSPDDLEACYLHASILNRLAEFEPAREQIDILISQLMNLKGSLRQKGATLSPAHTALMQHAMRFKEKIAEQLDQIVSAVP